MVNHLYQELISLNHGIPNSWKISWQIGKYTYLELHFNHITSLFKESCWLTHVTIKNGEQC